MNLLVLAFTLLVAALLQALFPASRWTGFAPVPVLASLVLYYALTRPRAILLAAAAGAGLVQDSLAQIPLGYSVFCYCVASLVVERVRDTMVVGQWTTHLALGALLNAGVTMALLLLLAKDGLIAPAPGHILLRLLGALVLGGLVAPPVFQALDRLEKTLGLVETESEA